MYTQQIALPFFSAMKSAPKRSNIDLIGRAYRDGHVTVTVVGECDDDVRQVLVRRRPGGMSRLPGWLMRSIFAEEDKKRKQPVKKIRRTRGTY